MRLARATHVAIVCGATLSLVWAAPAVGADASRGPETILEVRTVPPMAGMTFTLDGRRFASPGRRCRDDRLPRQRAAS